MMDILSVVAIGLMAGGGVGLVLHTISRPAAQPPRQAEKPSQTEGEAQFGAVQEAGPHPKGLYISYMANEDWKAKNAYLRTVPGSEEAEKFRNDYALRNL